MVAEQGDDNINLVELSRRSGAALRTIYNAFTDKQGLVAQAALAHFNSLFVALRVTANDCHGLAEAVERSYRAAIETVKFRAFSATTARIYFSNQSNAELLDALHEMPRSTVAAWLKSDEVDTQLVKRFGEDNLQMSFANLQWGIIHDWANGNLSDDVLIDRMTDGMVWIGLAFGNRAGRAEAKRLVKVQRCLGGDRIAKR